MVGGPISLCVMRHRPFALILLAFACSFVHLLFVFYKPSIGGHVCACRARFSFRIPGRSSWFWRWLRHCSASCCRVRRRRRHRFFRKSRRGSGDAVARGFRNVRSFCRFLGFSLVPRTCDDGSTSCRCHCFVFFVVVQVCPIPMVHCQWGPCCDGCRSLSHGCAHQHALQSIIWSSSSLCVRAREEVR